MRWLLHAVALALLVAAPARGAALPIVIVPGLTFSDLEALSARGAVGLLVPGAGPETSEAQAKASLVRAKVRNSLLGGSVKGPSLVRQRTASKPPARGPAIVLALPRGSAQPNDRRYPIAVLAEGYRGLLTSRSTRIPGLVSIVDVAPTALGRSGRLRATEHGDPVAALSSLDRRIRANGRARLPLFLLAAGVVAAAALIAPRAGVLGLAGALAANLGLGLADASAAAIVFLVTVVAIVAAALLGLVLRSPTLVGVLLAAIIAAYLIALAVDDPSVALSPLGPTQNGRFFGLSNLLSTLLLVPAVAAAALLGRRFGPVGMAVVAVIALVAVAGNRFGADGGGAVVLVAGFAALAVAMAGGGARRLALALAAAAGAAAAVVGLDAATGGSSHVTDAAGGGPGEVASDLARRLQLSYERTVDRWYVALVVAGGIVVLALLLVRLLRTRRAHHGREVLLALAVAVAVSLVVNDSPNDVVLAGLLGCIAVARYPWPRSARRLSRPEDESSIRKSARARLPHISA